MSSIYTGRPAPLDGKRKLSAREASQRAKAMACVRSRQATRCQGQVYVSLFFDGTGNNKDWVEEGQSLSQTARNKHSNVARLFQAHVDDPQGGVFAYYMPGVGTPFREIGDTSKFEYGVGGSGFGYKGADRINFGILSVLDALHIYATAHQLLDNNQKGGLANKLSRDVPCPGVTIEPVARWAGLTAVEETLAAALASSQRKVLQVNVAIFGFSRGAAEARACAHWLSQVCERHGQGGLLLAGVPLRIGFMGIFDTVAAVGLGDIVPFADGHMAWAHGTQGIHPAVEDCAHFIALHEQRASFPLEASVGRGNVGYPGMHSDVGGGYCPGDQGKAMPEWGESPQLSQIPLIDMHFAAIKAGVPMMTIEDMQTRPALRKAFATDVRMVHVYNDWLTHHGVPAGDVRSFTEAHTRHYIRWRSAAHLDGGYGLKPRPFFTRMASAQDVHDILQADQEFGLYLRFLLERERANASASGYIGERMKDAMRLILPGGMVLIEPGKSPLSANERQMLSVATGKAMPPHACVALFEDYVHDSRAGFRVGGQHEFQILTGGYLRHRWVFKEASSGDARIYGWANEGWASAKAAADALGRCIDDLWTRARSTYDQARARIHQSGRSALQTASATYQAAELQVVRRYQAAERELMRQLAQRYEKAE